MNWRTDDTLATWIIVLSLTAVYSWGWFLYVLASLVIAGMALAFLLAPEANPDRHI